MGRWRTSLFLSRFAADSFSRKTHVFQPNFVFRRLITPLYPNPSPTSLTPTTNFGTFRHFSAFSNAASPIFDHVNYDDEQKYAEELFLHDEDDEELGKISVRAIFLCTRVHVEQSKIYGFGSVDLKSLQVEISSHVVPPTSRSINHIALRFCNINSDYTYGSAVLFNVEDHEVESYLDLIRRHASGLLQETRKDDYVVKEKPLLSEDMQGGPDYIVLKNLDIDSIRIISSVLGQSIALDYFVSQKTGTFTMDRKKLFQLVGKANSNLADVILKVGLFDRSEIAWREAKYAQIYEYLREEYEVTQRFGNLDYKLKFVEHNIHFLQEALQNRKSDLLEWCIIVLLSIENVIGIYEIIQETNIVVM
ncbi:Protein of unknown function DUF155 [Cynara cardunculus var. scolymus]|uniref:DUF155 domain-containing protein n=1 Tax=Cynara cardunculus var. scolymus TaxID=59895 RepID=A0A103XSQ6_CYNCS|nr:Protein of unknown function DUF155 [Cynara cardunculus var. scolymus]